MGNGCPYSYRAHGIMIEKAHYKVETATRIKQELVFDTDKPHATFCEDHRLCRRLVCLLPNSETRKNASKSNMLIS